MKAFHLKQGNIAIIRQLAQQDVPQLVELCDAHAKFEACEYDRKNKVDRLTKQLTGDHKCAQCLVVESNGLLLGYATWSKEYSTWDACHYAHMDCLFLTDKSRGKGYGKQLMEAVIDAARQSDCAQIQWQTPEDNASAIQFYNKLGATQKKKTRFYLTT